jgi:septal ring factor EnvC (AmiA/AmiB activator)
MSTKTIEFDPDRLSVLDQKRRSAQALQRASNDEYQSLRIKKNEARLNADRLHRLAHDGNAAGRASAEAQAEEAEAEVMKITKRMGEIEAEMSAHASAAGRANTLFRNALKFAVAEGLEIPAAFEGEAAQVLQKGLPQ